MEQEKMRLPVILATLLFLLPCSCAKQPGQEPAVGVAGSEIAFGAATGYLNGAETRTIYSGEEYSVTGSSNPFERIDWVAGEDDMTIFYNQQSDAGTYVVTGVSGTSDENSYAQIESLSGKLCWGTEAEHRFYAMYPKNGVHNTLASAGHVTGMIPGGQTIAYNASKGKYLPDMSYAYMVAYAGNQQITQGRVDLPFTPAMTAFEFRLQRRSGDGDVVKLTQFELISASAPLTGTFEFDITGGDDRGATWNKTVGSGGTTLSGTGTTITVNFPTGGVPLPAHGGAEYLDFTVFALPVALSGLSVRLSLDDGSKLSVPLNDSGGSPHTFAPCKKHVITNTDVPDQEWEYVLGDITGFAQNYQGGTASLNGSFVSYRQKTASGGVVHKEPVPFSFEYYDESTSQWVSGLPSWLTLSSGELTGSAAGMNLKLTMAPQTNAVSKDGNGIILDEHTTSLRNKAAKSNYDLSRHSLSGAEYADGNRITANCYVISSPGTYMFPLVYGNSLYNKGVATLGYRGAPYYNGQYHYQSDVFYFDNGSPVLGTEGSRLYIGYFLDDRGQKMTLPNDINGTYVYCLPSISNQLNTTNLTASILWMDAPGLVTNVSIKTDGVQYGVNVQGGTRLFDTRYMTFTIPQDHICQGNALLAVKYNGRIAWSWHIWVTDENLTASKAGSNSYQWAPVNLGWCDGQVIDDYAHRECKIRIRQAESGSINSADGVFVKQYSFKKYTQGDSPLYQWGRKDPIHAGLCTVTEEETSAATPTRTVSFVDKPLYGVTGAPGYHNGSSNVQGLIANPCIQYSGFTVYYYNSWNSYATDDSSEPIFKTVYDPSPPGYLVPPVQAYNGFNGTNFTWSPASGTKPAGRTYSNGLFFPAIGIRPYNTGALSDRDASMYWSDYRAQSLYVQSTDLYISGYGNQWTNAMPVRPVKEN